MPESRQTTRSFHGQGGFVQLRHFNKYLIKKTSKKLHNYKAKFWKENLTQRWTQSAIRTIFSQNLSIFFNFQKRQGGPKPLVSVDDMHQCLWISLYILENACMFWLYNRALNFAWSSCMFDKLLKMPWVLNMSRVLNLAWLYM